MFGFQHTSLSKETVLKYVSQVDIMERYLHVKVQTSQNILSPLRKDHTPTCRFHWSKSGSLYLRDFSGHFWGDCFDVVQYLYGCNFDEAIQRIAYDYGILDEAEQKKLVESKKLVDQKVDTSKPDFKPIQIQKRVWEDFDAEFWVYRGVSKEALNFFLVSPVRAIWVNNEIVYNKVWNKKDPAYAYKIGTEKYIIYYPKRDTLRFICNGNYIQGWNQLPETGEVLVITKSLKDVMVLWKYGIPAIAPSGESSEISAELINDLRKRFTNIFSLFDFDRTGRKAAFCLRDKFHIPPFFFTNGYFGTKDYGAKDTSDYYLKHGNNDLEKLIKEIVARFRTGELFEYKRNGTRSIVRGIHSSIH